MKRLCINSILLLSCLATYAQSIGPSAYNTTGGSNTAGTNTIEYAIGGVVSGNTFIASNLIVTPGVLQPVTAPNAVKTPAIDASLLFLFPNPAAQTLFLQPRFATPGQLDYTLLDMAGRQLFTKSIALQSGNERQEIDMRPFASGQYHLRVLWNAQGKTGSMAFKVQKVK